MRVVVPFDAGDPKTRLAPVLGAEERIAFAQAMRDDVCDSVLEAGGRPVLLSTEPIEHECPVRVDERALGTAVDAAVADTLEQAEACGVVMADCALASAEVIRRLGVGTEDAADAAITLVPARGGGTNALVIRDSRFETDFHGVSISDHRNAARSMGVSLREFDSYRLGTDVDVPGDLPEVLLHGRGRAVEWLADRFTLTTNDGRVTVERQ